MGRETPDNLCGENWIKKEQSLGLAESVRGQLCRFVTFGLIGEAQDGRLRHAAQPPLQNCGHACCISEEDGHAIYTLILNDGKTSEHLDGAFRCNSESW